LFITIIVDRVISLSVADAHVHFKTLRHNKDD